MEKTRYFAPGFVMAVGPFFVAVDIVQPVAVVVTQDGRLVSVESWAHLVGPPSESPWPNRRFGVVPDRLLVHDLPDGGAVAMTVRPDGTVTTGTVSAAALDAKGVLVRHPRMISAPRGTRTEPAQGWRFTTWRHRAQWSAAVEFRRGDAVSTWAVGRGSIVAHAQDGESAALCVRRAGHRPWEFDPAYELHVVQARSPGGLAPTEVTPIDISRRCWPRTTDPSELVGLVRMYLASGMGGCGAAVALGGREVRLEVRQIDSDPVIELSFELPDLPGVRLVRVDRPVNELGHLAGFHSLNILIDEDVIASDLVDVLLEDVGPVDGRLHI